MIDGMRLLAPGEMVCFADFRCSFHSASVSRAKTETGGNETGNQQTISWIIRKKFDASLIPIQFNSQSIPQMNLSFITGNETEMNLAWIDGIDYWIELLAIKLIIL